MRERKRNTNETHKERGNEKKSPERVREGGRKNRKRRTKIERERRKKEKEGNKGE